MSQELAQRAMSLFREQRLAEALPLLEQLVEAGNTPLVCILALAEAREATGNEPGAIRLLENLYRALPQDDFAVALVAALQRAGDRDALDQWLPVVRKAHPANTRLAGMQAEHQLKRGDFGAGFDLLPYRWALSAEQQVTATLPCPAWDGQPFGGTLLVGTEQGLGDVVLWSSMFSEIAARGQQALVACEARLLPLFRRSFPTLAFADRASDPLAMPGMNPENRKIESADLARLFRRSLVDFPARASWLVPDATRVAALRDAYRQAFPGKRLLGLSWRSHRYLRGESKSIPVEDLAPLWALPDTVLVNLQYGDIAPDLAALQRLGLDLRVDASINVTHDIDGTAALVAALDGVVSSSNTMAHLAGGLGQQTRVMLPGQRYVLWYWGYEGNTVPWYPAMKLFRGPPRRGWRELAGDVAVDIAAT